MRRSLLRLSALLLPFAWACSDAPTDPAAGDPVISQAPRAGLGPVVSDAAALQAALDAVADGSASTSTILVQGTIVLSDPLVYESDDDVTLLGRGARIVGPTNPIAAPTSSAERVGERTVGDALQVLGAPDLTVEGVRFEDQTGHGIFFELEPGSSGRVDLTLRRVRFTDQGLSGVWLEDQESDNGVIESPASIHLDFDNVTVRRTGFADGPSDICGENDEDLGCEWADFDGMRLNEGGLGDITFDFRNVEFTDNAGDGIEFDEIDEGGVSGSVQNGSFDRNGAQPQFPVDLEDGFDIDEAGMGDIVVEMVRVSILSNIDEGLDLDEEDGGDIDLVLHTINASGNQDDNVKLTEEDGGDVSVDFVRLRANGALDGNGVVLESEDSGSLSGSIDLSQIRRNDGVGLEAVQDDAGPGTLTVTRTNLRGNGDGPTELTNVVVN